MRWIAVGALCWGAVGGAHAAGAAVPAVAAGCSSGWDQLLPPDRSGAERPGRACATEPSPPAAPALAQQMAMYSLPTARGPLGPRTQTIVPLNAQPLRARSAPSRRATTARAPAGLPVALAPLVDRAAQAHDIDPLLLHAIARVESRHQPRAVSHAGAHGLMQVIVPTARRFGVSQASELHDPQTNLLVSARYLKTLQQRFGNDLPLVLAAYNAGEGAVEKHGRRIPPYRETQGYVRKVLAEYGLLRRVSASRALEDAASVGATL